MKDILVLLENKISDCDNKIREINKELNKLNSMYVKIKPKNSKKINYYACNNFSNKEIDLLDELTLNIHPINRIYNKLVMLDEKIDKANSFNEYINLRDTNDVSVVLLQDQRDLLSNKMIEMGCDVVISTYENYKSEKEKLTNEKNNYRYILSKFTKKERINPFEIGLLSELISNSNLDNKEDTLNMVKNYSKSFEVKTENNKPIEDKKKIIINIKPFKDSNLNEEKDNDDFDDINISDVKNYANTLCLFENEEDVIAYLDGISYFKNFNKVLSMMIDFICDEEIKNIIEKYMLSKKEDIFYDKVDDDITVFYYDYRLSSPVYKDIKNIPKEFYKDILHAINEIKKDGAINKREQVVKLRNVFKIRRKDFFNFF